jgi:hypothetical protein
VAQQAVQQGGHRWVVIWVVLAAQVLDREDGVGGQPRGLGQARHQGAQVAARALLQAVCLCGVILVNLGQGYQHPRSCSR